MNSLWRARSIAPETVSGARFHDEGGVAMTMKRNFMRSVGSMIGGGNGEGARCGAVIGVDRALLLVSVVLMIPCGGAERESGR